MENMMTGVCRSLAGFALLSLSLFAGMPQCSAQSNYLDNETLYSNQDPNTETRRSDHFRVAFGHFNRDTGTPMTEQLAQGNLQMYEQMWNRWVNELGLHDINESVTAPDGNKYRANFNFLMTWNDGGGGGAYSSMDGNGFFYAMANTAYARFDPPSGATPHEFGHVWEGAAAGFNGTDSSGAWWECTANWMQLQFLNSYPQAGAYIANGMYYPAHGRDYYETWVIYETAYDDPRYGAQWVNSIWTNATPDQQKYEFILDRMIRCDSSGSPDKAGAVNDLWGAMAKKMVTWDFQRQQWLAAANADESSPDAGVAWTWYQRCRTPLVSMPGTNGWFRPAREHLPMEFGFNIIPLTVTPGSTVTCNFQPQCDPLRQSDWRACLVAVSTNTISAINMNSYATYSSLWNRGANSITLAADQTKLYLVVIATPKPMKIPEPVWQAYLSDAGLQFPYAVSFSNATPANVAFTRPASGVTWKNHTNAVDGTICRNIASGATVAATAYVSSNAMVLNTARVLGYARIEDYAVVRNSAQVRDNAVVSGRAVVQDNAQVYGNAKVRDWARVFGYAEIYENARVIEHANCGDGDAGTHTRVYGNAVVKGTTYVYNTSTFNGCLIVDGDSANGNGTTPSDHGVHFGWSWGHDAARFSNLSDNNYLYAQHNFERENPVFAMDQLGINHGFLMNDCRAVKDSVAPARGGRVLTLNGTNQYVELHNSLNDFKDTTLAVWFKRTGSAVDQRLWSFGDGTNRVMYLTPNDSGTGGLRFVISNGVASSSLDGGILPANVWTHVAVVFGGTSSNCTLYVNGLPVAANPAITLFPDSLNAPLMANANYLGRGNAGNYFQGSLDDFRVYMKSLSAAEITALYSSPAPAPFTPVADTPPPTPAWLVPPAAVSDNAITMSATRTNSTSGWSEYYFQCTSGGGHDSGWVSFNKYTDVGLTPGTTYTYTVMMRDKDGDITAASSPASAATPTSSAGLASFAYGPVGTASGRITMAATPVTNASGMSLYKFDRSGKSSGWISSPYWSVSETGGSTYSYKVTVGDGRGNSNVLAAGVTVRAVDSAAPLLTIPAAHWQMQPYPTITNSISMTAQPSSDPSGVQYYFRCVSGGGPDSGWQSSSTYVTPALPDGTYVYQYQLRDQASPANTNTTPSMSYAATIKPTTGYHACSLSQVVTNQDDYLVSFPATVMRVNASNYFVKDLASGAAITVEPAASNLVTVAALALKNVTVQGHLYTRAGSRIVTWSTVTSNGLPTLYTVSGKVTNSAGVGIPGATVYFSDSPNATSNSVVSVVANASGSFSKGITAGSWFVAAGSSAYNSSADRLLVVSNASVAGVDFGLVSNAVVRGTVARRSDGTPISGASVYFSRTPGASASPSFTAITAANGSYAQPVQDGVWYVAAGGTGFYPATDLTVTVAGLEVSNINFTLGSSARNIPQTGQLLFSAVTDALPASGPAGDWPTYLPAGRLLTNMASSSVEIFNGVKWEANSYADGDGYRQGEYSSPIPVNGMTVVVAVKPKRNTLGTSWTSIVDLFYDRLVLGIRNNTGRIDVRRNGSFDTSATAIPDGQPTILSLVVQTNGQYKVFANGSQVMNITTTSDMTSLVPNVAGPYAYALNVGRNNPDGWTTFNGNIGDVFVYTNALADGDRQTLEADLMAKFIPVGYQINASANTGGTLNPSGSVLVAPGASQSFAMTPAAGNIVSNVVVDGVSRGALNSYTFTNVTAAHTLSVTFAPAPQPPVVDNAAGATNLAIGVAQLRGTLGNGPADVQLYWGTADAGTNGNWLNVSSLQGITNGSFSSSVSNLLYGIPYFYRTFASNQWGVAWAPATTNFTTLRPPSSLANAAAAGITTNAALLNATFSCAGAVYDVIAFWNTTNGGTNASAWTNSIPVGTWTNHSAASLVCPAAGLSPNTTYYFTFRANNSLDTLWATNVQSFTTLPITPPIPPTLTIAPNGSGGLDITWPDTYPGTLLTSPVLGAGAVWTPVGSAPVHIGGLYKFTVTLGPTNAFFGLSP